MKPHKNYVAISLSLHQIVEMRSTTDDRYRRKVERITETPPTEKDWADYRAAKEAHDFLIESPYFIDGGNDYGSEVEEPTPSREYAYAETEAEWLNRCRELIEETR